MSAVFVNDGRVDTLAVLLGTLAGNIKVGLFQNNVVVDVTKVLADLVPATFAGYAPIAPAWGAPAIDGNGNALGAGATCTFTAAAGVAAQTIYGYYVYNSVTGKLWFGENLSAPVTINAVGQSISVTPNFYDGLLPAPL